MKKCPQCAELIQPDASKCRYCGANQASGANRGFVLVLAVIVALGVLKECGSAPDKPQTPAAKPMSEQTIKGCNKIIEDLRKDGSMKRRPEPSRIDVDEIAWASADAQDKRYVIATLACAAYGRGLADLGADYVVVYGARSGKRLAMGTANGVNFE